LVKYKARGRERDAARGGPKRGLRNDARATPWIRRKESRRKGDVKIWSIKGEASGVGQKNGESGQGVLRGLRESPNPKKRREIKKAPGDWWERSSGEKKKKF